MVVTKYAPPPGYGSQQAPPPRPSSQNQSWPPTSQQYGQSYSTTPYAGPQPQAYGAAIQPPSRPGSTHSLQYAQAYPQQASPPIGAYPTGTFQQPAGSYTPSFDYSQQSPPTQIATAHDRHSSLADAFGSTGKSYFPQGAVHSRTKSSQGQQPSRHRSTPSITYDYAAAYARLEAGEHPQAFAGAPYDLPDEALETDFDDECYYFEHPEEINEELSIGEIVSVSALPTSRPLPSTFNEAELEALAPRPQFVRSDSCISEYFTVDKGEEQLNTVRLSDAWAEIKDDLIFKEFLQLGYETIRLDLMTQKYRNRIDSKWERSDSSGSVSHFARASIETTAATEGGHHRRGSRPPSRTGSRTGHRDNSQGPNYRPSSAASNHSRASSVTSRYSNQRPKALEPIRDQAQDDVLAKLGVTGSPRLVYETPGPAFGPPASARSSRQSSVASNHDNPFAGAHRAPSEPQSTPQDVAFNNPWGANGKHQYRQSSGTGLYDLTSSEYTIMEDPDATPRPKNNRSHGLKRHYEGDHRDANREKRLRDNEATPKQGRKQNRAPEAYGGRRW